MHCSHELNISIAINEILSPIYYDTINEIDTVHIYYYYNIPSSTTNKSKMCDVPERA